MEAVPAEELQHFRIILKVLPADDAIWLLLLRQEHVVDHLAWASPNIVLVQEGALVLMIIAVEVAQQSWHPLELLCRLSSHLPELVLVGIHDDLHISHLLLEL